MAKRRKARRFGKKALAILLTLVMAFSLFNVMALAAGQLICEKEEHSHTDGCYEERTHEHTDECYKEHEHGRRCDRERHSHDDTCSSEIHEHSDACYRAHEHSFGCVFGCRYDEGESVQICDYEAGETIYTCGKEGSYDYTCGIEKDLTCELEESYRELVCGKDEHTHGSKCYKEEDYVDHLDIHIGLTAKYILDGETYTESVELTREDYTSGRLQITSTGSFRITSTEIYDAGQRRFNGSFAVCTYENPVYYSITLVKDVSFDINGETVTIPMTFSKTVHYWADNICESLFAARGYKDGSWARGEFVGGHMDFKLGASESTGSSTTQPDPTEPVKHTLTVQKNVAGVTLDSAKTYTFGIYSGNDKVDTVNVTVSAGGTTAIGTTALDADTAYFVVEEGSPAIEGYTLTTSVAVGSGDAKTGAVSESFTLTGDASVVFTNTYAAEQPPVEPPVQPDPVYYDLTVKYVDGEGVEISAADVTENIKEGTAYNTASKTIEGYTFKSWDDTSDAVSGTMNSDKTVVYVYEKDAPVIPDPVYYDLTVKYVDGEGVEISAADVTENIKEGTSYNTASKTIEGYTFKNWDDTSDAVSGTMDSDKTVVYVYEKDAPVIPDPVFYDLTVKYVDTDGSEISAADVTENIKEGTPYSTTHKAIEGYTFKQWDGTSDTAGGTMTSDKTVVYIYEKNAPVDPPAPPVTFSYTVVAEYYTNNSFDGGKDIASVTDAAALPGTEEVYFAYAGANDSFGENKYGYTGVTLEGTVFTIRYDRTYTAPPTQPEPQPPVVTYNYYDLTVNYVDISGNALQAPIVEMNKIEGSAYTTEQKAFEGYTFVETTGDAVSGIMNADKVVTYVYMEDEVIVDIPEEDPPLADLPDEPVDLPDEDVPLVDLPDEDVPLADTPKTGDNGMGLYIALMILSAMGLAWVVLSGRRARKN